MEKVIAEIIWLSRLVEDLSITPSLLIPIHSDSQPIIHIAHKSVFHKRTKRVALDAAGRN